ncbi:MAG: pseudouridine synthase, partial [Bdellovibrio sp.]
GTTLQKQLGIQIYPVHRLDFEVSGLVLYAKNPEAHRKANAWFEKKEVQKTYRALTSSQGYDHIPENVSNARQKISLNPGDSFTWTARVLRGKRRAFESNQGKESVTLAKFLGLNLAKQLMWDLNPVTGRSHQLRFDLSRHGFPIIGDTLYGSKVPWQGVDSIALRSYAIDFSKAPLAKDLGLPEKIEIPAL